MTRRIINSIRKTLICGLFFNLAIMFFLGFVSADISNINAYTKPGGGADLTFSIINQGETGGFNAYAECDSSNSIRNFQGTIKSGETKEITLSVAGGECSKLIKCKIFVENVGGVLEESVSFTNECSLCSTEFETCIKDSTFCSGDQIKKCDSYCRTTSVIKTCNEGCVTNGGNPTCKEDVSNYFLKENGVAILFYSIIILVVVLVVLFLLSRKKSKKQR